MTDAEQTFTATPQAPLAQLTLLGDVAKPIAADEAP